MTDVKEKRVVELEAPSQYTVKSAGRALQIMEMFEELRRPARVSEIAQRLAYPQSSTSILLRYLVDLGYVTFDPSMRCYQPSCRMPLMGAWLFDNKITRLSALVEEVSQQTGETVVIATRNGTFSQYIHVVQAKNPIRVVIPRGTRCHLIWSAAGFVLLSGVPDYEIQKLVRRTNAENQSGRKFDTQAVLDNVKSAKGGGYFVSRGLVSPDFGQIAMRLPSEFDDGGNCLVLGVSAMIDNLVRNEAMILGSMRRAIGRAVESSH